MSETILAAEPTIRLAAFLGVLVAMALWEVASPRRRREIPRVIRWTNNLALVVLDTAILRLTFPIIAVGLAVMAEKLAGASSTTSTCLSGLPSSSPCSSSTWRSTSST